MADPLVREYSDNDRASVRALLLDVYRTARGFDALIDGNPLGRPLCVVADDGERIVGFNAWNPWRLPFAPEVRVLQSGASAVHESTRGKGVFAKLLGLGRELAAQRGVEAFFGFPNPASYGSFTRAGWQTVDTLQLAITVCAPLKTSEHAGLDEATDFIRWRYSQPGVSVSVMAIDGQIIYVIYRVASEVSQRLIRLLDIVDASGARRLDAVPRALTHLGQAGVVMTRLSRAAKRQARAFMPVPKRWQTPIIVLPVKADNGGFIERMQEADWLYGDVDAA